MINAVAFSFRSQLKRKLKFQPKFRSLRGAFTGVWRENPAFDISPALLFCRPPASCMHQSQHPQVFAFDLVNQTLALMWNQLARAGDFSGAAELGEIRQPRHYVAEKLVHPSGR